MSSDKRKRSMNFSMDEKMRFLRILRKKGKVIISKVNSHDLQTNRLKEEAWTEITNELNASGNIIRTTYNLKRLWQKMKTEVKTVKSTAYNQTYGTGGGPSIKMEDPVLELVAQITGRASSGIELADDCDSSQSSANSINDINIQSNFESERLDSEQAKIALIQLQCKHLNEQHALKIKHANLKTKILEAILEKIKDEKPVDPELLKIVSII